MIQNIVPFVNRDNSNLIRRRTFFNCIQRIEDISLRYRHSEYKNLLLLPYFKHLFLSFPFPIFAFNIKHSDSNFRTFLFRNGLNFRGYLTRSIKSNLKQYRCMTSSTSNRRGSSDCSPPTLMP